MVRLLLIPLLAALAGCGSVVSPGRSVELQTTGPVAVEVVAFAGSVTITQDPSVLGVSVTVHRRGNLGLGRRGDALDALAGIEWVASVEPTDLGQAIVVRATCDDPVHPLLAADIEIVAPSIDGVSIVTSRGHVVLRNIAGPISVKNSDGNILLASSRPLWDAVTMENRRGDIHFRVHGESTAVFDCRSVGGEVACKVIVGRLDIEEGTSRSTLHARLNEGTNRIRLRTVDGDVRIVVIANPTLNVPWMNAEGFPR